MPQRIDMKKILVCGAGGFIGSHLVERLKKEGHYVVGVDLKEPLYSKSLADEFYVVDLRDQRNVESLFHLIRYDEIYQLAADMGGAGYIFTGEHDADIMHNSVMINLNILDSMRRKNKNAKIFYSSSACMYPEHNQLDPNNPVLSEDSAYPANPDSEYGWEKLFSERLYLTYAKNYGIDVRIARFHNVFGPYGSWNNGKEKAPAALCRKVATVEPGGTIEIWGPGTQTRSFLFIDECLDGIQCLMKSEFTGPVNLGSERMISINNLVYLIAGLVNKSVTIKNIPGPMGVMGRTSDNRLIREKLNWAPTEDLEQGIQKTYNWIVEQINSGKIDD
jgi:nucleoside-diphosphate-sugar epimerase